ncbi:MAG: FecR domain-containing protein [Leptospira sp.]|nr:FecR domain-containing protein [Leptospira sp.]
MRRTTSKNERTILLLLLLSAIFFVVLFFIDLNKKIDISKRSIIGSVEFKNNIIQRKFDDHMVWETIKKDSQITNRDTIRSDSFSDALIVLNDGTKINMDENSMFYLDISGEDQTLDLSSGNINIRKSENSQEDLKIKSSGSIISMRDGELNLNRQSDGVLTMHVEKGSASITNKGRTENVTSGNVAEIDGNSMEVKKVPFSLEYPANNKIFPIKPDRHKVIFKWEPKETYKDVSLEISRSSDFSGLVKKIEYPKQTEEIELPLGSYYWRINSDVGTSPRYRFHVYKESKVNGKLPLDDVILTFVEKLPAVAFQWNENPLAKDYVLEIAEDKKFNKLSSMHTTKTNSIAVDNLNQGNYYWRVKTNPITSDIPEQVTPVKSFKIQKTNDFPVPEIVRPNGIDLGQDEYVQNGIFAWNNSDELIRFRFQLSNDKNFANYIVNESVNRNFYKPSSKLNKGVYYWRVQGFSASGRESDFSSIARFKIIDQEEWDLRAKESLIGETSSLEISENQKDSELQKLKENELTQKKFLKSPMNTVVDLSGKKELRFDWEQSKDPNELYLITIFNEESGLKKPVYQAKTKNNYLTFDKLDKLGEGKFSWEVSVLSKNKVTRTEKGNFVVALTKLKSLKPEDIEFISPSVLYKEED